MASTQKESACHNSTVTEKGDKLICDVCGKECELVGAKKAPAKKKA